MMVMTVLCATVLVLCVASVSATATPVVNHVLNCQMDSALTNILRLEREVTILTSKVESLESKLKQNEEGLSSMKSTLRDALLKNITRSLATQAVDAAYQVSLSSDISQIQTTPLKFDNILYNQGEAYNMTTGVFTAPVSGTYVFWAYIMSRAKSNMDVRIHKGSTVIGLGHTRQGAVYGVAAITTATYLHYGDQVWHTIVGTGVVPLRGDEFSSYGGAIVRSN